ncbi:MAG TPA: hypothetical protein VI758_11185 [Bacteroidota bacterium]
MKSILFFASIVCVMLLASTTCDALPKYASRTGFKCGACHVNPTGKGMRNEYGSTYGRDDITLPTYKNLTDYDDFSTKLGPSLSFGGDYRSMFYYETQNHASTFFQMQAAFYLDFRVNKMFQIYADKDFLGDAEIFGLARILPMDGYIKVGRFVPAYGTKVDDHNYFIRGGPYNPGVQFAGQFPAGYPTGLRFGELSEDTGLELGFAPSIFTFNAGVFDGFPGVSLPTTGTKNKSFALRGDARFRLADINWNFGGSYYDSPTATNRQTFYGVFGALTVFENLTLTSEMDYVEHAQPALPTTVGLMWWNELNWVVYQGIDLKLAYESYDPDKDIKNGIFSQVTVGAEFFLLSGVEVRPLYRLNINTVPNTNNKSTNEFVLLFHFFV